MNNYLASGGIDRFSELYKEGGAEYAKYKLSKSFTEEEQAYLARLAEQDGAVMAALEHDNNPSASITPPKKNFKASRRTFLPKSVN